ncbi:MAG: PAS domain-containing protein [Candidatus Eisenbacteria bacterium]
MSDRRDGKEHESAPPARGPGAQPGMEGSPNGSVRAFDGSLNKSVRDMTVSLVETSPAYFVAIDPEGRVVYMNSAMLEATGYTKDEVLGVDYVGTFVPAGDRERRERNLSRLFDEREPSLMDGPIVAKDGTEAMVRWSGRPVDSERGDPRFVIGFGVDITESFRARRALEKRTREAQQYLDLAGVMFLGLDSEGRVASVNRKGCEILGGSESDIVGKDWFATFLPEDVREQVRGWYDSLMNGDGELFAHAKNAIVSLEGDEKIIEWDNIFRYDDAGRVVGTLSSGVDVTEAERAAQTQRVIHEIWNAAHAARDTRELFGMIHEKLGSILNAENFFIALYDSGNDSLSLTYFVDEKDQDTFDSFPAGKTMTGYVVRNNTSLMLTREEADKWVEAGIIDIIGTPSQIWLGVPLRVRGAVIGALVLQSYTNPREYGPADRDMLEFVSGQIGFAIEGKRSELDLRTSEAKNQAIIDAVPDLMFQFDSECRFLTYQGPRNSELAVPPEFFIGKRISDIFPPELADRMNEAVVAVLKTGVPQEIVYRLPIPFPNGDPRDFEARMVPSGDGRVLSVVRDITERKRAERMLRVLNEASLAMERTLTPDQVLEVAADSLRREGLHAVVTFVDEDGENAYLRYMSFDPDALARTEGQAGISTKSVSIPIDASTIHRQVLRDRQTVFEANAEMLMQEVLPGCGPDVIRSVVGELGLSHTMHAPLVADNDVFGVLTVHSGDLSPADGPAVTAFANQLAATFRKATLLNELEESLGQLQETQDQLLQAQKMEAVGRLAGGVAHDFNNLLTAMKGYAELLLTNQRLDGAARADVEQIKKAADQAAGLTRQLLAFSRRQPLQRRIIDLNKVVSEMDGMLRRLIGEDIELVSDLHDEIRLKADPGQIEQVVINLVVNARDAMPEGGRLSVKTKAVVLDERACSSITGARPGWFACVSIEDTGSGIPKEIADQIFEPFFSTKGPGKGTGLGLAVVYGIVKQHEGWINVYSEPRHGTVFKIYIPAADGEAEGSEDESRSTRSLKGAGQRILLVEDERTVREFASRALAQSGYTVLAAADAEEALRIFRKEGGDFALVFSDVVLPDKSGIRLIGELAQEKPDVRVMLSSGYTDQKSQWPVIEEKGYRFLQKPYSLTELLNAVREAVLGEAPGGTKTPGASASVEGRSGDASAGPPTEDTR